MFLGIILNVLSAWISEVFAFQLLKNSRDQNQIVMELEEELEKSMAVNW